MNPSVRLLPFSQSLARKILGPSKKPAPDVIAAKVFAKVRPQAILAGQLDRVTGTDEHSALDFHLGAVRERVSEHAPVYRWTLPNALVGRNGFVSGRIAERYGTGLRAAALRSPVRHVAELRYCHDYVSWRYFGHWMMDSVPKHLIDADMGELWMPHQPAWTHAPEFVKALGLRPAQDKLIYADRLHVYQDFSQGPHKAARYARIRARLHAAFDSAPGTDRVYLMRGTTGAARAIRNEDALVMRLSALGWTICDVAEMSAAQLHRRLHAAAVVVSIEGSQVNHAQLALEAGSVLVCLCPADRFNTNQLGRCRAIGIIPGIVVLQGDAASGYHADPDEILRTVDLALALSAH